MSRTLTASIRRSALLLTALWLVPAPVSAGEVVVSGPITGGVRGTPFASPTLDLAARGYVVEEFFLDGTAHAYQMLGAGEQSTDGVWQTERQAEGVPFRTRILVVRPKDASRFNGTVIAHWQNVTAGFELGTVTDDEYLRGYAWVGISAQAVGVNGVPGPGAAGLRQWDPERYGSLNHPGDDYSYSIFTQAGRAVGVDRPMLKNDPMGGLSVQRVIAAGASQSAARLRTYINGVHPIERAFDAYIPYIDFASATPFSTPAAGGGSVMGRAATMIRGDLDVPVFVVNSETEVLAYFEARQPDTDRFRFWEVPGTSHVSVVRTAATPAGLDRPNWLSYRPVYDAALRHMHTWLTTGAAPPTMSPIEVATDGDRPDIRRDALGNALGGVRLPAFAAPSAEHRGQGTPVAGGNRFAFLYGYARDFTPEELTTLYPDRRAFLSKYAAALETAIASGVVLPEEAPTLRQDAEAWAARLPAQSTAARPTTPLDGFYWLNEQNKASLTMLVEEGIITKALGTGIAKALTQVIADGDTPGALRSSDYLVVEADMISIGGPDVSRLHSGRSRQDLGQAATRLRLRDAFLTTYGQFIDARATLLAMAERHPHAILPFYTHGVQAQPTSLGHYLGGYLEAMTRSSDRYQQAWARLNLSPLGGAAGGTSSFPVNRARLADLLGFDGLVVNSFDAGQIANQDNGVEVSTLAASGALTISMLAADLTVQYADPHPWFQLQEGSQTGVSSIMPQKRNPIGLERLHLTTSTVTGQAVTYLIQANNVMSGMGDYKGNQPLLVVQALGNMYDDLNDMLGALVFHPDRALQEVNNDYSMTTELADILQRDAEVPFRVGHHFASEIVSYGRSHTLKPAEIPYEVAQRLFAEAWSAFGTNDARLPLTEPQFRRALSGESMVASAKPVGGPQESEVIRMLAAEQARLDADRAWLVATRLRLDDATRMREEGVAALLAGR